MIYQDDRSNCKANLVSRARIWRSVVVSRHSLGTRHTCEVTWKAAIDGETLIQDNRTM